MKRMAAACAAILVLALAQVAQAAPVTLEFWHCWGGFREPIMQEIVSDFTSLNPDIKVEIAVKGCGDIHEQFMVAAAGGVAPDVVMVNTSRLPGLVLSNLFQPLDPFVNSDGVDLGAILPSAIDLSTVRGLLYSLPTSAPGGKNEFLFYNLSHLEEAGLGETDLADWARLEDSARKLTRFSSDGQPFQIALDVRSGGDFNFLAWVYNNDGEYLSPDGRTLLINNDKGKETLRWLVDFHQNINRGSSALSTHYSNNANADQAFYNGATSMLTSGLWMFSYITTNAPDLAFGVVQRPPNAGAEARGVTLGGWSYGVPAGSGNGDAAWQLVKWLTYDERGAGKFTKAVETVPALFSLVSNPDFWAGTTLESHVNVIAQAVLSDVVPPILPIEADLARVLNPAVTRAFNGEISPENALDEAARVMQGLVDEYWVSVEQ